MIFPRTLFWIEVLMLRQLTIQKRKAGESGFKTVSIFIFAALVLIKVAPADTVMKYFEMAERAALSNFPWTLHSWHLLYWNRDCKRRKQFVMEKRLHVEFVFLKYDFTCFYINILDSVPERSRLAVRFLRNELGQGAVDVPFAVHLLFPFLITFGFNSQFSSSKDIFTRRYTFVKFRQRRLFARD